ncbi:MAG TPA: DUF58 domain-containing protein [Euzebya sp.]|nr:DUF58 domain-containing protein [Euzebya sp.]
MVLVLAAVLYLAGSNIGSGWVIILTAALLGALAVDLLAVWRVQRATGVSLWPPTVATTIVPASVVAAVERPDLGTTLQLSSADGASRAVVRGAAIGVATPVDLGRGHHREVRARARTIGPLGLAHATRTHTTVAAVWCRPGAMPAAGRVRAIVHGLGDTATAARGRGEEDVRGVREFAASDPRRAVHWKATARHGRLMVREVDAPQGAVIRLGIAGGIWPIDALDLACEVVASLAEAAVVQGHDTEVLVDGATHRWDDGTWHLLAGLPPAIGVPARPLADDTRKATLWLRPAPTTGVIVDHDLLGDRAEASAWLHADA